MSTAQAEVLLDSVLSYLIVKRAQAVLGLHHRRGEAMPGESRSSFGKRCSECIKLLNARGAWAKAPHPRPSFPGTGARGRASSPRSTGVADFALPDWQAAYLAGIIDGEGCVSICRTSKSYYTLRVYVGTTCKELARWCLRTTGLGTVRFLSRPHPRHQDVYLWRVDSSQAGALLQCVAPYLVIKTIQAAVGVRNRDRELLPKAARAAFDQQCSDCIKLFNAREQRRRQLEARQGRTTRR